MNCDGVVELLSAYVDGELAAGDLLRVEQHLRRCQSCAGEVDSLRQTIALVSSLEEVELPVDFHAKLHARLLQQGPPVARRTPVARPWQRHVQWASAAAAAAVLGLGLAGYQIASHGAAGVQVDSQAAIAPEKPGEQVAVNNPGGQTTQSGTGTTTAPTDKGQGGGTGTTTTPPKGTGTGTQAPANGGGPKSTPTQTEQPTTTTPVGTTDKGTSAVSVAGFMENVATPDPTVKMSTTTYSLTAVAADPSAKLAEIQALVPGAADAQGNTLTLSVPAAGSDALLATIKEKLGATVTEADPVPTDLSYQYEVQYQTLKSYETQRVQLQKAADTATDADSRTKANEALAALKEQADRAKADLSRTVAQSQKVQIIVTVKTAP